MMHFQQKNSSEPFSCYLIGNESLLVQCAQILLEKGHTIYGLITGAPPIAAWARENNLPHLLPDEKLADALRRQPFDYFFNITNLTLIPAEILSLPGRAAINFHDGPLPRYAGLYATSWALLNQEREYGVTWHLMTGGVDEGDILKQRRFEIAPNETAFTLNAKCYEAGMASFGQLVDDLAAGRVIPQPQNLAERTYFAKNKRPTAVLNFTQPAANLEALVRALDFGPYTNPLALPKLFMGAGTLAHISDEAWGFSHASPFDSVYVVKQLERRNVLTAEKPGTVIAVTDDGLTVAAAGDQVVLRKLARLDGQDMPLAEFTQTHNLRPGDLLPGLDSAAAARLGQFNEQLARHESFWQKQLAKTSPLELPYANRLAVPAAEFAEKSFTTGQFPEKLAAAFAAYLARLSGNYAFAVGYRHHALARELVGVEPFFAPYVSLTVQINPQTGLNQTVEQLLAHSQTLKQRQSYSRDLPLRQPDLKAPRYPIVIVEDTAAALLPETELALLIGPAGTIRWLYDTAIYNEAAIQTMQRQFARFLQQLEEDTPLAQVSLLSNDERRQLLVELNDTAANYPRDKCIHHLFESQVEQTPHAIAVAFEAHELTYAQLNARANQLAHHLCGLGVGPETRVGIYMERSLDLMVALLGTLKAGGAYLPLDPDYPAERITFMVEDAAVPVILTTANLTTQLPPHQATVIQLDADWPTIAAQPVGNPSGGASPQNLSYVIYTSGSTGKPKGVMVEHRNVVNFFAGMDQVIPHDPPGVWLAVTSLSFDISVLELFWTLARGFKVVLYAGAPAPVSPQTDKPIDFSLFYFASDESEDGVADKYHLLLEGAKFADQHGFVAVWTPERHFHAFGGLYPNPAVAGAALATITQQVDIRAGSCVLPLHSPIRVAEEWALVDNLSKGRVGIAFAAGWQPNDFVLMPQNYTGRKAIMFRDIEVVRRLWRGETVSLPGPNGSPVDVRTLPRPIQPELPIWITTAGNPDTYRQAGANGFHVLTHLLGQSVEELAEKVAVYRQAWAEAGHPGQGTVSLMLHTFVGDDDIAVRQIVRGPMTDYLRSAMELVKAAAWHFPTFKQKAEAAGKNPFEMFDSEELTPEDMEALLAFAFDRYFTHSGLFGTPETCIKMVNRLKEIGVDEIACLIDFGVPSATVMAQLPALNRVKEMAAPKLAAQDYSIAALIERHGVTHFQCTPSMAGMLAADTRTRAALGRLQTFLLGGEAFPASLAKDLRQFVKGNIINMYGPTETTIWSTTYPLDNNIDGPTVLIGRPIANTQVYILDANLQPTPPGVPGELFIGGDGVVRGYLNRPELTAERFIKTEGGRMKAEQVEDNSSFILHPSSLLYRTGDLVRYRPDGTLEFMGRLDHQIKLRGYRIELGEIEALLNQHPAVRETAVIAREDTPGDARLVAYFIPRPGQQSAVKNLADYLRNNLPEFMIPAHFVMLDKFPLTPNKKTDRKALPPPERGQAEPKTVYMPPQNELEGTIAAIWQELLKVQRVGVNDNFFDLGGHSLLTVQAHRRLCQVIEQDISITDMFRFPTVRSLAEFLGRQNGDSAYDQPTVVQKSMDRAKARREAMLRRRG